MCGATILHELLLEGRDGQNWKAIYQLLRQPDDSFKIGGVMIVSETESKEI